MFTVYELLKSSFAQENVSDTKGLVVCTVGNTSVFEIQSIFTPKAREEKHANVLTYEHDQLAGRHPSLISRGYSESTSHALRESLK